MANNAIHLIKGTPIVLALSADFDAANGGYGWENATEILDLTSVAAGAAEQSSKFDLAISGAELAQYYTVEAAIEMDVAPVTGTPVDFYVGFSTSATDGTGNPAGLSGVSGVYAGYSSNLDASLGQLTKIGTMAMTVQIATTPQLADIGIFRPKDRYAMIVVDNNTAQAFEGDAVQQAVRITPWYTEVQ